LPIVFFDKKALWIKKACIQHDTILGTNNCPSHAPPFGGDLFRVLYCPRLYFLARLGEQRPRDRDNAKPSSDAIIAFGSPTTSEIAYESCIAHGFIFWQGLVNKDLETEITPSHPRMQ
jgi:hypothetical protein